MWLKSGSYDKIRSSILSCGEVANPTTDFAGAREPHVAKPLRTTASGRKLASGNFDEYVRSRHSKVEISL
jgi:hypothetical protein